MSDKDVICPKNNAELIDLLCERCKDLESELTALRAKVEKLEDENGSLHDYIADTVHKNTYEAVVGSMKEAERNWVAAEERCEKLEAENEKLNEQISGHDDALLDMEGKVWKMTEARDNWKAQFEAVLTIREKLRKVLEAAEWTLEILSLINSELNEINDLPYDQWSGALDEMDATLTLSNSVLRQTIEEAK